jgi:Flp pilus assembly protein TadD
MGCSKPSADEHLKKAEAYLTESRLPEAVLELRAAVQADPKRGDIRAKLADAYMQNRDISAAAREYINAADLLPDDFKAQLNAGSILLLAEAVRRRQGPGAKSGTSLIQERRRPVLLGQYHGRSQGLRGRVG